VNIPTQAKTGLEWATCQVYDVGTLTNDKATTGFTGSTDDWECNVGYGGDSEFAWSGYSNFWIKQCRPVDSCHDDGGVSVRHEITMS
jgi:hypothetical protein